MRQSEWSHKLVYEALVARGNRVKKSSHNRYVVLYGQQPNCALLYEPGCDFSARPLHLNPGRKSWRYDIYAKIWPALKAIYLEKKSVGQEPFLDCTIRDWSKLAEGLQLRMPHSNT